MAAQLGRQTQLDLEAVAQAGRDQHALGQQPGSAVENGGGAARPTSSPVASITSTDGPWPRRNRRQAR